MDNSQYEKQYKQQVTDFFNKRTSYDDFHFDLATDKGAWNNKQLLHAIAHKH